MSTTEKGTTLNHNNAHDEHSKTHPPTLTRGHASPPGSTSGDDHILTVGWDGPDDPENPRKYA
jgi:hypothetical protein